MKQYGCIITTSESILFELMGDAKHISFKQISALLKETKETTAFSLSSLL
jgi:hypothetical protein